MFLSLATRKADRAGCRSRPILGSSSSNGLDAASVGSIDGRTSFYAGAQFRLRVQDDGKGFDEALLPCQADAGHYGVPGMRERAELMGGTLTRAFAGE
jgi:nitrate/nitrite-specific signal transduction histidine kinase